MATADAPVAPRQAGSHFGRGLMSWPESCITPYPTIRTCTVKLWMAWALQAGTRAHPGKSSAARAAGTATA